MESKFKKMFKVFEELVDSQQTKNLINEIAGCPERPIILCGVGKNWYICRKLEKTFLSLGFDARALDPTHALHGDVGVVNDQLIIFVSKSGTTKELVDLAAYITHLREVKEINPLTVGVFLNSMTPIKKHMNLMITSDEEVYEFDENNIVPTLSINLIQMLLDYVAVMAYEENPGMVDMFKYNHPGGDIGSKLGTKELIDG